MTDKKEALDTLEGQLTEIRERIAETTEELDNLQTKLNENNNGSEFEEIKQKKEQLYKELDDNGKKIIAKRNELEKKKKKCKSAGGLIFVVYAFLAVGGLYVFNVGFTVITCLVAAAIGVLISGIYVVIAKALLKREYNNTFGDPNIIEYDKKNSEYLKEFSQKRIEKNSNEAKLNSEIQNVKNKLRELSQSEKSVLKEIKELDFNFAYNDTILFYGKDKGNYYEIYLDGQLYDTVRGRQIVRIMLSPGIHSFKVDNTAYNLDGSITYSYTFNTQQIIAGETISAYPIVCEYKYIERVSGEEFQKITKTQLL